MNPDLVPSGFVTVSPSDDVAEAFSPSLMGLQVGTGGAVAVVDALSNSTVILTVPSGGYVWGRIVQVLSTGTTASNITGLIA